MLYYAYRVQTEFGSNLSLVFGFGISTFYFIIASLLLVNKDRVLYQIIMKNEKLIWEMRKLLEAFPHGVLIKFQQPSDEFSSVFTNEEFNKQIYQIRNKIEELDNLPISIIDNNKEDSDNQYPTSLNEYLNELQEDLSENNSKINHKVVIKNYKGCPQENFYQNDDFKESEERIFKIKSIEVTWEGRPSFMHVFIDTTDILNLEIAKNNIKWQKIMFASASHEFRTPLNSIINSYFFITEHLDYLLKNF